MFSRYDRDALAEVINRYLTDGLTSFKFDDALSDIAARTKDETVKLGSRQIRGPVSEAFNWLHFAVVWLLFSPVALLIQALPEREVRWKVAGP